MIQLVHARISAHPSPLCRQVWYVILHQRPRALYSSVLGISPASFLEGLYIFSQCVFGKWIFDGWHGQAPGCPQCRTIQRYRRSCQLPEAPKLRARSSGPPRSHDSALPHPCRPHPVVAVPGSPRVSSHTLSRLPSRPAPSSKDPSGWQLSG